MKTPSNGWESFRNFYNKADKAIQDILQGQPANYTKKILLNVLKLRTFILKMRTGLLCQPGFEVTICDLKNRLLFDINQCRIT